MKMTTFDKRVAALEQRRAYRIASLADVVILAAWRQSGDPRTPNAEDVEWDPVFADIFNACPKRGDGWR
jgi:hypothetical protein